MPPQAGLPDSNVVFKRVVGDAYTNTLEGAFSLFKRQIVGAHHHVSPQHLDRYWDEFEWKYNRRKSSEGDGDGSESC